MQRLHLITDPTNEKEWLAFICAIKTATSEKELFWQWQSKSCIVTTLDSKTAIDLERSPKGLTISLNPNCIYQTDYRASSKSLQIEIYQSLLELYKTAAQTAADRQKCAFDLINQLETLLTRVDYN